MINTKQLLGITGLCLWMNNVARADYTLNMTQGASRLSREIYDLHMLIFWICVAIGFVVFSIMFYSIYHHRKSRGAVAAQFHESAVVEIIWSVIPFIILIAMAIPATKAMINLYDTSEPDITIKVTGYQWRWRYEYLDEGIDFVSTLGAESNEARQLGSDIDPGTVENYLRDVDNPLVIPINKKIRFLLTSGDVLHSWWVPEFGWKQDTVPGFINEAWTLVEKPGVYRGQCAELCGRGHAFMPIVVIAKTEEDYQRWVEQQTAYPKAKVVDTEKDWNKDNLFTKGKEVYSANCAGCHQTKGQGIPGTFPAIKGSPVATGNMSKHIDVVLNGKGGTMPPFGGSLDVVDLAAVITYQRNAFGNDMGDFVHPSNVKSYSVDASVAEDKGGDNEKSPGQVQDSDEAKPVNTETLTVNGEEVYNTSCASCHQANGQGVPGTFPSIKGSPVATGEKSKHIDVVLNGVGEMMPAFGNILEPEELAAVITYQRNAFGNDMGGSVNSSEFEALLDGEE